MLLSIHHVRLDKPNGKYLKKEIYVFPSECGFAAFAVNVGHGVQSGEQDAFLGRPAANIHPTPMKKKPNQKHRLIIV